MTTALNFVITLFGDLLISLANIDFVLGYSILQWLVAGSFMVLIWQFALYILGRTGGSMRKTTSAAFKSQNRKGSNYHD